MFCWVVLKGDVAGFNRLDGEESSTSRLWQFLEECKDPNRHKPDTTSHTAERQAAQRRIDNLIMYNEIAALNKAVHTAFMQRKWGTSEWLPLPDDVLPHLIQMLAPLPVAATCRSARKAVLHAHGVQTVGELKVNTAIARCRCLQDRMLLVNNAINNGMECTLYYGPVLGPTDSQTELMTIKCKQTGRTIHVVPLEMSANLTTSTPANAEKATTLSSIYYREFTGINFCGPLMWHYPMPQVLFIHWGDLNSFSCQGTNKVAEEKLLEFIVNETLDWSLAATFIGSIWQRKSYVKIAKPN